MSWIVLTLAIGWWTPQGWSGDGAVSEKAPDLLPSVCWAWVEADKGGVGGAGGEDPTGCNCSLSPTLPCCSPDPRPPKTSDPPDDN